MKLQKKIKVTFCIHILYSKEGEENRIVKKKLINLQKSEVFRRTKKNSTDSLKELQAKRILFIITTTI